jgi:hypothetical protein
LGCGWAASTLLRFNASTVFLVAASTHLRIYSLLQPFPA